VSGRTKPAGAPEELDGGSIDSAVESADFPDDLDKKLLNRIQSAFPLESRPYAVLGRELGLTEAETLARVRALRARKIIRRLGANFHSAGIGFSSTLCAARVGEEKLATFIAAVNRRPGVTHNYLRRHAYNVWFTLISPSREAALAEIAALEEETGTPVLNLPAARLYKINVDFNLEE
jgi:DNA-binding Lrp family transcriptional regulator